MKNVFILFGLLFLSGQALAWGGRGHNTICEVAVFLVKEPSLKEYLQNKPQMMGHVCNMPDFYWKSISGEVSKLGNPTHFIDPEIISISVDKIPADYKKLIESTVPFYFEKKIEMMKSKLSPEPKVFFRYKRVKDSFETIIGKTLIEHNVINSLEEIGDISQVGGGINKSKLKEIISNHYYI